MAKINKNAPTVDIIAAMFSRPFEADDKWAYRHGAYKEIRKHQRRGTEFFVSMSDETWTFLDLRDECWYAMPTWALTGVTNELEAG